VTPAVLSFQPESGHPGTSVTITGTTFVGVTGVTVDGIPASFKVKSATSLTATVPAGAVSGAVGVTTAGGTSSSASAFSVPPLVTGFLPDSAPVGTPVTVSGSGFDSSAQVTFGGQPATVEDVTPTSLQAIVPDDGNGPIAVTTSSGSAQSGAPFAISFGITGFSPPSAPHGVQVSINGFGFLTHAVDVRVGGVPVPFHVQSDSLVTFTVPDGLQSGAIEIDDGKYTARSATPLTVTVVPVPSEQIAFARTGCTFETETTCGIFSMNGDGTSVTQLTTTVADADPDWSPDGAKIAFTRYEPDVNALHVFVMNADGGDLTDLAVGQQPSWSPDGTRIAYQNGGTIWVMNADGTDQHQIEFPMLAGDGFPSWSPDGTRIAFLRDTYPGQRLETIAPDGTGLTGVYDYFSQNVRPDWTPDGTRILISNRSAIQSVLLADASVSPLVDSGTDPSGRDCSRLVLASPTGGIEVALQDGTGLTQLTTGDDVEPSCRE
jgi:hypothetical protein